MPTRTRSTTSEQAKTNASPDYSQSNATAKAEVTLISPMKSASGAAPVVVAK